MKGGTLSIIIIIVLIALGGWYYYSMVSTTGTETLVGTSSVATTTETVLPTEVATSTAPEDDFTVTGYNFGFNPSALTVSKGDHVKISFDDTGGVHDFVIDELGVRSPRIDTSATTSL